MAAIAVEGAEIAGPTLLRYAPALLNYGSVIGSSVLNSVISEVGKNYRETNNIPDDQNDKSPEKREKQEYDNYKQKVVGNLFEKGIIPSTRRWIKTL